MLKRIIILLALLIPAVMVSGQDIRTGADGLYYQADGKIYTGEYKDFHSEGQLKTQMNIQKGAIDGLVHVYFPGGQKNEIRSYKDGQMHGQWITWNEKGQKIAEANYLLGEKDGKWFVWDENGTLLYDMTYSNGARSGTWKMYDHNGNLTMQKDF